MSLRDGAIQAMTGLFQKWQVKTDKTDAEVLMPFVLDALLDYLTEHREEWPMEAKSDDWGLSHLLQELREDTDE